MNKPCANDGCVAVVPEDQTWCVIHRKMVDSVRETYKHRSLVTVTGRVVYQRPDGSYYSLRPDGVAVEERLG